MRKLHLQDQAQGVEQYGSLRFVFEGDAGRYRLRSVFTGQVACRERPDARTGMPHPAGDMMAMIWTKDLSVGNDVLDSEHRLLMELVNDVARAAGTGDRLALSRAIRRFRNCLNHHFATEETFAFMLNFPFALHKVAHQNMQAELELTEHELQKDGMEAAHIFVMEHYAGFLRDWLIRHIDEEDMQMKPALQIHPYDFKIGGTVHG